MTVCVSIKPNDTVFFRDARSFTAGVDNIASSQLPSPLSVFGIIGNYYLEANKLSLQELKSGSVRKLGKYSDDLNIAGHFMRGPFLSYADMPYFTPPANVFRYYRNYYYSYPALVSGEKSNLTLQGLKHLSLANPEQIPPEAEQLNDYLSIENIKAYLLEQPLHISRIKPLQGENGFFEYEYRNGHKIDADSHTVAETMLYFPRHIRLLDKVDHGLEEASFLVDVSYLDPEDFSQKAYNVGGERRIARFSVVDDCFSSIRNVPEIKDKITATGRFFLYLATPAIFNKGWTRDPWPDPIDKAKLVAAAVNKPLYISGWKRESPGTAEKPRLMTLAAPAGSVYFFEAEKFKNNDAYFCNLYDKFNFNMSVSSLYPSAGFGTSLIGTWDS